MAYITAPAMFVRKLYLEGSYTENAQLMYDIDNAEVTACRRTREVTIFRDDMYVYMQMNREDYRDFIEAILEN